MNIKTIDYEELISYMKEDVTVNRYNTSNKLISHIKAKYDRKFDKHEIYEVVRIIYDLDPLLCRELFNRWNNEQDAV
jgi:hypothetical protein